jgi:hypothetical protein
MTTEDFLITVAFVFALMFSIAGLFELLIG